MFTSCVDKGRDLCELIMFQATEKAAEALARRFGAGTIEGRLPQGAGAEFWATSATGRFDCADRMTSSTTAVLRKPT
jgi:hypothetical protein